jgi:hypothetical protein
VGAGSNFVFGAMDGLNCGLSHLGVPQWEFKLELEEALAGWVRGQIARIEQQLANSTDPLLEERVEFSKLAET